MSGLKNPHPLPKGFLLFELMVAVTVLAISLAVITRSFSSSLLALHTSASLFKGGLLLEKKMLELELEENPSPPEKEEGTFEEFGGVFRWTVERNRMEELPLDDIFLTVHWKVGDREKKLSVTTALPRHEEK